MAKLEEEKDTLQLAARLIAQDKYCRNFDTSLRWQNVSKGNTTDHDFTNRVQLPNTSDSYLRNRYELLIDEGDYSGSNEPRNIHDRFKINLIRLIILNKPQKTTTMSLRSLNINTNDKITLVKTQKNNKAGC